MALRREDNRNAAHHILRPFSPRETECQEGNMGSYQPGKGNPVGQVEAGVEEVLEAWAGGIAREVLPLRRKGRHKKLKELLTVAAGTGLTKGIFWALIHPGLARQMLRQSGLDSCLAADCSDSLRQAGLLSSAPLEGEDIAPVLCLDGEAAEVNRN